MLAIDPGRSKCGLAIVSRAEGVLHRSIHAPAQLDAAVRELRAAFSPDAVLIGDGTACRETLGLLTEAGLIRRVPERNSTLSAVRRYFRDHPPSGWRRLLPRGLLHPPVPVDDYAAVVLAEEFLKLESTP